MNIQKAATMRPIRPRGSMRVSIYNDIIDEITTQRVQAQINLSELTSKNFSRKLVLNPSEQGQNLNSHRQQSVDDVELAKKKSQTPQGISRFQVNFAKKIENPNIIEIENLNATKDIFVKYCIKNQFGATIVTNGKRVDPNTLQCIIFNFIQEDSAILKHNTILEIRKFESRLQCFIKVENLQQQINDDIEIMVVINVDNEKSKSEEIKAYVDEKIKEVMESIQEEREKAARKISELEKMVTEQKAEIESLKKETSDLNGKIVQISESEKISHGKLQKNSSKISNVFWEQANQHDIDLDEFEPKFKQMKKSVSHQEDQKLKSIKTISINNKSLMKNFDDNSKLFNKNLSSKQSNLDKYSLIPQTLNTNSVHSNPQNDQPDLVYFYSEPLVDKIYDDKTQKYKLVPTGSDTLATDLEYRRLIEILKSTGKDFQISKQAINFESLKEMVARKPKIIHISCHGDFCDEQKEFYLQFEGIGDGVADKFYQSRLLDLLGEEKDHGIKLAFVSACHSEEIGSILLKCNIPCVISVNSNWQVADEICLIFSRHLYMQLLNGVTVSKAFQEAQRTCRASKVNCESCCCAHSHTDKCKWQKYAIKNGYDKAHELHSGKCSCRLRLNKHKTNCKIYQDFMTFLRTFKDPDEEAKPPPKNIWAFDDDFDFEQNLVAYDQKVDDNVLCCCKKELDHDESIKFLLKGDEQNLKTVLFKNRQRGQLVEIQDKNVNYKISNIFDQSWIIGRNKQIQQCVKMLTNENGQRFIKISGISGIGRHVIAVSAIKYCTERNYFRDGAYQIQIESRQNCQGFLNQLFQSMRLNIQNKEDLIDFIKNHHIVILIVQTSDLLKNDKENFQNLLTYLLENTNYLKIILIIDPLTQFEIRTERLENKIKLEPLNRFYAAKVLRSYDKANEIFITKDDSELKNHAIFDNQLTNQQILDIYMLLKSDKTLDEISKIFQDQQKRKNQMISENAINQERNFNIQLILYSHMAKQYPDEKNLLYFLCQAPLGLTLNDIQDYVIQHPHNFGNWQVFLNDMIYQFDQVDSDPNQSVNNQIENFQELDSSDIDSKLSIEKLQQTNSGDHGFKVIFQRQNEDIKQSVYYIKKVVRAFINDHVLQKDRQHQFFRFIKYFSKLGRQYVRNLNIQQQNKDFDINILSAQIDQGLWDKPKYSLTSHIVKEEDIENLIIDNVITRFNINEANFMETFNYDIVTSLYPKMKYIPQLVQFLDEIYITFPSILIMINREKDAIIALDMAEKICNHYKAEMKQTMAKIQLMQISLEIKNKRIFNIQKQLLDCHNQFKQTFNKLGIGETYLLEAIWHILEIKIKMNVDIANEKKHREALEAENLQINKFNSLFVKRETYKKIHSVVHQQEEDMEGEMMQFFDNKKIKEDHHKETQKLQKKILHSLEMAQKIFKKFKQELSYSRVVLVRANYLHSNLTKYKEKFDQILGDLLHSQEMFEKNLNFQHQIECLNYIALIYQNQEDYQMAKKYIHQAIGQAKQIQDYQSVIKATQILEKIQNKIQISSNNMIIVLQSFPIIEISDQNAQQIQSEFKPQTQMVEINREHCLNLDILKFQTLLHLNKLQMQLFIKFEFLNKQQLDYIRDYGCRILEIHSNVYDADENLCIEGENGTLVKLQTYELYNILKPKEGDLNVDVVFINVQNGEKIAQVFQKLGVPQVFTYKQLSISETTMEGIYPFSHQDIDHMFMKNFSTEMIIRLVNKQSFYKAFQLTKKQLAIHYKSTQIDQISWVEGQENYGEKLFDEDDLDERKQLQNGRIEDQSSVIGPINIDLSSGPLIGRKTEIHTFLKEISNSKVKMICIMGNQGIGKTRFVKEVARYANLRRIISDGVYYLDFSQVSTQKEIDELFKNAGIDYLLQYNQSNVGTPKMAQEKSMGSGGQQPLLQKNNSDMKKEQKSIMLIYDNIDKIQENIMSFKWHIKQILKQKFRIKLILTHKKKFQIFKNRQEVLQINLMPLSPQNQVSLVKFYSLREFSLSEFSFAEQVTASRALIKEGKAETDGNKIEYILKNTSNIQLCQGNTQALMLLAFVLRTKKMNEILIEQIRTKKINKQINVVDLGMDEAEKPLTFFQELKEKKNLQKIVQEKIGMKLLQMMQSNKAQTGFGSGFKDIESPVMEMIESPEPTLKKKQSNKSKRKKPLMKYNDRQKSSLTKAFKSSDQNLTHFKDIKEIPSSPEEQKKKPPIIQPTKELVDEEERNYSSGYNDYYNVNKKKKKNKDKDKDKDKSPPQPRNYEIPRRFTQFHSNELDLPQKQSDDVDDSFQRQRTSSVMVKRMAAGKLALAELEGNDPVPACFQDKCSIQIMGAISNQLVSLLDKVNDEYLQNILNIEFDKKQFEVLPEDCFQIKKLIINQNLEKSNELLTVKVCKSNGSTKIYDSMENLIYGKKEEQSLKRKRSYFKEDFYENPLMKQLSNNTSGNTSESMKQVILPDTIKIIIPVGHLDKNLILKQEVEKRQQVRHKSVTIDPNDQNLLRLRQEAPKLSKNYSVYPEKKVQFFQETAKLNDIEEEVDSSSDDAKKTPLLKNKSVQPTASKKKRIEAYDGSASDGERVNFDEYMKKDPKQIIKKDEKKLQKQKLKETEMKKRQIYVSSSGSEEEETKVEEKKQVKSSFFKGYKMEVQPPKPHETTFGNIIPMADEDPIEDIFEKNMMLFHGDLKMKKS